MRMHFDQSSTKKIVVVEDNWADLVLIESVCEDLPFAVELINFSNGMDMFRFLQAAVVTEIKLFLIDYRNPVMNGLEILQKLMADAHLATIPVIIFSSNKQKEIGEQCLSLGALAYVEKPFTIDEYETMMKNVFQLLESHTPSDHNARG